MKKIFYQSPFGEGSASFVCTSAWRMLEVCYWHIGNGRRAPGTLTWIEAYEYFYGN